MSSSLPVTAGEGGQRASLAALSVSSVGQVQLYEILMWQVHLTYCHPYFDDNNAFFTM